MEVTKNFAEALAHAVAYLRRKGWSEDDALGYAWINVTLGRGSVIGHVRALEALARGAAS